MIVIDRFIGNPIISPENPNSFEGEAAFNCSLIFDPLKKIYHMVYRAMALQKKISGVSLQLSTIGYAKSADRINFEGRKQLIPAERSWEKFGCEDPRVTKMDDKYYIFYTALSNWPPNADGIKVAVAVTRDFEKIEEKHLVTPFNAKAMAMFPERINGKIAVILTADTDRPPSKIAIAYTENIKDLWDKEYWNNWYESIDKYTLRILRSDKDHVEIGASPVKTKEGWLILYCYIKNYFSHNKIFGIEALLLDLKNPRKIIKRTTSPLFIPEKEYEIYGKVYNVIFPSGALLFNDTLGIYYGATDSTCCLATCSLSELLSSMI